MHDDIEYLSRLSDLTKNNDPIDPDLYKQYNVKRGLRDDNGAGVLVGLTQIGDVVGYEIKDGKKIAIPGKLIYRGYNVVDLVHGAEKEKRFGFEECVYLLLIGDLPTKSQLEEFSNFLGRQRMLPEFFSEDMIMKAPSSDIMNKLARGVLALYSYDQNPEGREASNVLRQCIELVARFPCLAAYGYQAKRHYYDDKSMYIHKPDTSVSTAENFLRLIRHDKEYSPIEAEIMDLSLILHAEHGGGNNSSLTVHVVSSADTDTYSAVAAAVGSLKGRRHGGANIRTVEMMDNIKTHVKDWGNEKEVEAYLYKIARKKAFDHTGLIYGMGHAVYTVSDPREVLLREKAKKLAKEKKALDEYGLYEIIQKVAPRILMELHGDGSMICPNVDFYTGFIYSMMGIPRELYTPIFAVARIAGWAAHRLEEVVDGGKLYRPAYKNVCEERPFVAMSKRGC